MSELIRDLAMSIMMAWLLGVGAHWLRQPLLLAYLVAGFLLGPSGFGWVHSQESIATIAELGLLFMLFMIGLEIDLKKVANAGKVIFATGLVQIAGCCLLGVLVFSWIGLPLGAGGRWDALYLGVAIALSSTVIIVKVLYDKRELDTLPGRITLGILVLQDLFAILFLAVQPSLGDLAFDVVALSAARVALLVASALLISRYLLPYLFHRIARLPELVVVGALAWCFFVGELAEVLSLSREMGALIAGVSLSTFPYALDVAGKVTALRDFFITLFFVALGMTIPVPGGTVIALAGVMTVLTLVSRFVTVLPTLYLMRQGIRTGLLPAINLAQISEFSLVLVQVGVQSGQVTGEAASAASFAFVVLAVLSTFMMTRSVEISRSAVRGLKRIGLHDLDDVGAADGGDGHDARRILLLGFYRAASSFLAEVEREQPALLQEICVVDFNPLVFHELRARKVKVAYGDISHTETLSHASIADAQIVISSVPDSLLKGTTNEKLVRYTHSINPDARVIAVAETMAQASDLYAAGAAYVLVTRIAEAAELLQAVNAADEGLLHELRTRLEPRLRDRREVLP